MERTGALAVNQKDAAEVRLACNLEIGVDSIECLFDAHATQVDFAAYQRSRRVGAARRLVFFPAGGGRRKFIGWQVQKLAVEFDFDAVFIAVMAAHYTGVQIFVPDYAGSGDKLPGLNRREFRAGAAGK